MSDFPPLVFPDCPYRIRKDLIPGEILPLMKVCLRQVEENEYYCNIDNVINKKKSKKAEENK